MRDRRDTRYNADVGTVAAGGRSPHHHEPPFDGPETEETQRTRAIFQPINHGIVVENDRLMEEVARIVAESKDGSGPDIVTEPSVVESRAERRTGGCH